MNGAARVQFPAKTSMTSSEVICSLAADPTCSTPTMRPQIHPNLLRHVLGSLTG